MAAKKRMKDWEGEAELAELRTLSHLSFGGVAEHMGITTATLKQWCRKSYAIHDALPQYQRQMTLEVENAVLDLCFGQVKNSRVKEQKLGKDGSLYDLVEEKEEHAQGDLRALKYWLNNRDPERWRDKPSPAEEADDEDVASFIPVPDRMDVPADEE